MTSAFATAFPPLRPGVDFGTADDDSRMAWTPGRKQACYACRQRKRKCDAARPCCAYCRKTKLACFYTPPKTATLNANTALFGQGYVHDPMDSAAAEGFSLFDNEPVSADAAAPPSSRPPSLWESRLGAALPSSGFHTISQDDILQSQLYSLSTDIGVRSDRIGNGSLRLDTDQSAPAQSLLSATSNTEAPRNGLAHSLSAFHTDIQSLSDDFPRTRMPSENPLNLSNFSSRQSTRNSSEAAVSATSSASDSDASISLSDLPVEPTQLQELFDIFFEQHHSFLPCIHRSRFLDRLVKGRASLRSSPLIWAVLAVAASAHPDPQIRAYQSSWMAKACSVFERNALSRLYPTQTLQSAVWIVYLLYTSADMNRAWFTLGTAGRLANLLGFDRMDYPKQNTFIMQGPNPRDRIEAEEQRKTFWCIYFLEAFFSSMAGLSMALNERQFHINFPCDDDMFQAAKTDDDLPQRASSPFTVEPGLLAASSVLGGLDSKISVNHIFRATVLLSRIMHIISDLQTPRRSMDFISELAKLEKTVQSFSDATAYCVEGNRDGSEHSMVLDLWLMIVLWNCRILLYHPFITDRSPDGVTAPGPGEDSAGLRCCVHLARDILKTLRRSANKSIESCLNPFIVPSFLVSCRLLLICWRDQQLAIDHEGIEFILEILDHIEQKWPPVAKKYRQGIMQNMKQSKRDLVQLWMETGSYHSVQCV